VVTEPVPSLFSSLSIILGFGFGLIQVDSDQHFTTGSSFLLLVDSSFCFIVAGVSFGILVDW